MRQLSFLVFTFKDLPVSDKLDQNPMLDFVVMYFPRAFFSIEQVLAHLLAMKG